MTNQQNHEKIVKDFATFIPLKAFLKRCLALCKMTL